jgi:hypothetical protein
MHEKVCQNGCKHARKAVLLSKDSTGTNAIEEWLWKCSLLGRIVSLDSHIVMLGCASYVYEQRSGAEPMPCPQPEPACKPQPEVQVEATAPEPAAAPSTPMPIPAAQPQQAFVTADISAPVIQSASETRKTTVVDSYIKFTIDVPIHDMTSTVAPTEKSAEKKKPFVKRFKD